MKEMDKRSQIQFVINQLQYQLISRFGLNGEFPTDEQRVMIYDKITELREQLKNI